MDNQASLPRPGGPEWEGTPRTQKSGLLSRLGVASRKPVAQAPVKEPLSEDLSHEDGPHNTESAKKEVGAIPASTAPTVVNNDIDASLKEEAGIPGVVTGNGKLTMRQRFDARMPPNRRYLGRSRRTILIAFLVALLCFLALVLGLAIGLSRKKSRSQDLPLPSNKGIFTGDVTYYANELGLGSCGLLSAVSDNICAVSHILYDAASTGSNPNNNPLCGKMIRVTRFDSTTGGNRSVDVKVIDRCVGCKAEDLDLSLGAFEQVADEALGRVTGSWAWLT